MRLTRAERHLLDEGTDAQRKAMGILLTVGRLAQAPRLVPITSAHVSGASYKMIGDPGLEFLEDFAQTGRAVPRPSQRPLLERRLSMASTWMEDESRPSSSMSARNRAASTTP